MFKLIEVSRLRKVVLISGGLFAMMALVFLLGPRKRFSPIDFSPLVFDVSLESLDSYVKDRESAVPDLKPGNEARIVWADSLKRKTDYALVYLPGFSATHEEGAPLHTDFASRYGMNAYLARPYDHGRASKDAFKDLQPSQLVNSAREAIAIGRLLGEKIILMSCSTGGTYSILLAPEDDDIAALILYSPNIDLADPTSELIVGPWGQQLLTAVMGGEYNIIDYDDLPKKYWSSQYHIDGIIALKHLLKEYMTPELFRTIDIPVFLGFYYKDDKHKDEIVSVDAMKEFYAEISTPDELKRIKAFPDVEAHVISSYVFSKDLEAVQMATFEFADRCIEIDSGI